jgi:hypothetical protein
MLPSPEKEGRFRSILTVGTWHKTGCTGHSRFGPPLLIEWENDGREVADLTWSYAGYDFIASKDAQDVFDRIGDHFRYEAVIMAYGRLKAGSPAYESIRAKDFLWPIPVKSISIDPVRNGLKRISACHVCDKLKYEFKIRGLVADRGLVEDVDAFCIAEIGEYSPVFVTDSYRAKLVVSGLENIAFLESGLAT